MKDTIEFILLYGMGLCGSFIGWYSEMRFNAYLGKKYCQRPATVQWCPTPRAIFGFIIFSLLGPIAVVGGFICWASSVSVMLENEGARSRIGRWFTTPICKRDAKQ